MLPVLLLSLPSFLPGDTCEDLFVTNAMHVENDYVFKIHTSCRFEDFTLRIFDRWGNKKFETKDPALELDMLAYRQDNKAVFESGVYVYWIGAKLKGAQESIQYTGSITFIH